MKMQLVSTVHAVRWWRQLRKQNKLFPAQKAASYYEQTCKLLIY